MGLADKYRRDGTPYPPGRRGLVLWGRDLQNRDYQRVALAHLPNGVIVSTVWLGLDHNFGTNNRPLIFETMIFIGEIGKSEDCWRYSTEEEAMRGHKMLVKKWGAYKTAEDILGKKEPNDDIQTQQKAGKTENDQADQKGV